MRFQLEVGERARTVEISRREGGYRVVVDGREHLVDAVRIRDNAWSILLRAADGGEQRSVEAVVVPQNGRERLDVYVDGLPIPVIVNGARGRRAKADSGGARGGPERVTAPMPGKVVRVLVSPGAEVAARQGLVVVEAMKMENELRAARPGRVREVLVSEGQSVEAGTPLVVLE